jgi:hypothetical protein
MGLPGLQKPYFFHTVMKRASKSSKAGASSPLQDFQKITGCSSYIALPKCNALGFPGPPVSNAKTLAIPQRVHALERGVSMHIWHNRKRVKTHVTTLTAYLVL